MISLETRHNAVRTGIQIVETSFEALLEASRRLIL